MLAQVLAMEEAMEEREPEVTEEGLHVVRCQVGLVDLQETSNAERRTTIGILCWWKPWMGVSSALGAFSLGQYAPRGRRPVRRSVVLSISMVVASLTAEGNLPTVSSSLKTGKPFESLCRSTLLHPILGVPPPVPEVLANLHLPVMQIVGLT